MIIVKLSHTQSFMTIAPVIFENFLILIISPQQIEAMRGLDQGDTERGNHEKVKFLEIGQTIHLKTTAKS